MRLGELPEKILVCRARISITGLCDEYRDGVYSLMKEPWFEKVRDREVKGIGIIGLDAYRDELRIVI